MYKKKYKKAGSATIEWIRIAAVVVVIFAVSGALAGKLYNAPEFSDGKPAVLKPGRYFPKAVVALPKDDGVPVWEILAIRDNSSVDGIRFYEIPLAKMQVAGYTPVHSKELAEFVIDVYTNAEGEITAQFHSIYPLQ